MAVKNRKREENLAAVLQQRDEEWREEPAQRDRVLRVKLKETKRAFVNN